MWSWPDPALLALLNLLIAIVHLQEQWAINRWKKDFVCLMLSAGKRKMLMPFYSQRDILSKLHLVSFFNLLSASQFSSFCPHYWVYSWLQFTIFSDDFWLLSSLKQQGIFFSEHMQNKFLSFCVCGNWTDGVGQAENFLFSVINVSPEA